MQIPPWSERTIPDVFIYSTHVTDNFLTISFFCISLLRIYFPLHLF